MSHVEGYTPGASIKAWRDFFPNATIYAIDILEDVLFEEDRIKTYVADQGSVSSLQSFIEKIKKENHNKDLEFDFIIDDGSHELRHQIISINELSKYLKVDGIYIIEDIAPWVRDLLSSELIPNMEIILNRGDFIVYKKK
jgi:hypothetical protein